MDEPRKLSKDFLSSLQETDGWILASADSGESPSTVPQPPAPAPPELKDGLPSHIGPFRVDALLGRGSFGVVYRCFDVELKRSVAIKVPNPHLVGNVDLYREEAQVLASLEHANIVPVHAFGLTEDGLCYVVSKFIDGTTLAKRIKENPPSHYEAAELVATVAAALHHVHLRRVFHRDIKPANILLDSAGKPYVADFGLALTDEKFGQGSGGGGTLAYMSPEQARREGHLVDGRSDIFSLGVVFYELLTRARPFRGATNDELLEQIKTLDARPPRQLDDAIPKELERICLKALCKRATERYTTASDMADDLRSFLARATSAAPAAAPLASDADSAAPVRIVPKGLRSFDAQDADFFLELLSGPRDRDGLPDIIRFWKYRIEGADPEQTFRVGLIYGPSGCGKSSLVKAGLLPRLAASVIPLYIEATADDTEHRLLRGLRSRCPQLSTNLGLRESIAALRRGRGLPQGKKVLIVLDQFEQWLHSKQPYADAELVEALRHCDGERVQCIVMVRDDFWMAVTRFLGELEIHLVEGQNSAAVDLFDVEHARQVLAAFGRAFGKLPEKPGEISREQKDFLEKATAGLAEEGKVVCVRLALFADMMKGKPWTLAVLRGVGGIAGVGVTFLEETFSAPTAPPEHRLHLNAARAVLWALMPESSAALKGEMRCHGDLLVASGYRDRPRDFDELLRILDTEVRLITPTDPEGGAEDHRSPQGVPAGLKCYQLTHDYLVPSLRDWLTQKDKEKPSGRARLLLQERTREWAGSRQDRFLPSLRETLFIALYMRRNARAAAGQEMLRRAFWVHGRRLGLGAAMLATFALLVWVLLPRRPPSLDILRDSALPAEQRLRAVASLNLENEAVLDQVFEIGEKDANGRFVCGLLKQLVGPATKGALEKSPGRQPLLKFSRTLLSDSSRPADVRTAAFAAVKSLAGADEILKTVNQIGLNEETDSQLVDDIVRHIKGLDISALSETDRPIIVRDLVNIIRAGKNTQLTDASRQQLDKQPVEKLVGWMIESCRRDPEVDLNSAARDSIGAYMAACAGAGKAGQEQADTIAKFLQNRLKELVDNGAPEQVRDSVELEYLVQAVGLARRQTAIPFNDGLAALSVLLRKWESGDRPMVKSVIDAYVEVRLHSGGSGSPDAQGDIAALRAILRTVDDSEPRLIFARAAAAKALASLLKADALGDLIETAGNKEEMIDVWIAAIEELGEIGDQLRRQRRDTGQISKVLRPLLLWQRDQGPRVNDVINAALMAFAKAGDAKEATLLFPWAIDPRLGVQGISAISYMIRRSPADAPIVVREYLQWLGDREVPESLSPRPDEAVTNMAAFCPGLILPEAKKAEVRRAIIRELENIQSTHPNQRVRDRARKWHEELLRDTASDGQPSGPARGAARTVTAGYFSSVSSFWQKRSNSSPVRSTSFSKSELALHRRNRWIRQNLMPCFPSAVS